MKVRFKKLNEKAVMPTKAHATDAGFDLTATSREVDDDNGSVVYGTGIAVEIPEGYVGFVFPRSSICKKDLALSNAVGVIDAGYRGEIMAKFKPTLPAWEGEDDGKTETLVGGYSECEFVESYEVGDRIAQLIILPYPEVEFVEADSLSGSERGEGGYGSTGV